MPLARLVLSAAVLLVLLLATSSSVAHAQDVAGSPPPKPAQPEQPATGPGGAETVFPAARATKYGPASEGFWLWEPTTDSAADALAPPASAAILAGMPPDAAYAISVMLAGRHADLPKE